MDIAAADSLQMHRADSRRLTLPIASPPTNEDIAVDHSALPEKKGHLCASS
jgi:hypothetical protein